MNKEKLGGSHRLTLSRAKDLAKCLMLSERFKEAKLILNKSIRKSKASLGKEDVLTLNMYDLYGVCLLTEKECKRALKTFEKLAKIREKNRGFGNVVPVLTNYIRSGLLIKLKREDEALQILPKLLDVCQICHPSDEIFL